ncbi:MAG: glycosyltransferase family 2 protein [Candidatus Omnitrophota bacterium]|jgi:glycosyltransferase involved in cell wall biosynthesis
MNTKDNHEYYFLDSKLFPRFVACKWEKDITVFVSCYNEEGNIIDTFNTLTSALSAVKLDWEILVIDDASTDRSKELVSNYMKAHPQYSIRLLVRKENIGLAQNYIDGAFIAKGRYYKLVCGDNAEYQETLVDIFRLLGKADVIIPCHLKVKGRSFMREMLSRTYTFIVNVISGYKIKYYNGGALHLTYNAMRWHTDYHGYSFQADIITRLLDKGMSYIEIPAKSHERKTGASQALKIKNFLSVGHFFLDLMIRRFGRIYRDRKK